MVAGQQCGNLARQGCGINQFIGRHSGQRAAGDVAHHIAAGAFRRKANGGQRIDHLRKRLNAEPVQLNRLAHADVGQVACVFFGEPSNDPQLGGREDPIGNGNAHHEVI